MSFKEQVAIDNASFINTGEFGVEILWNGTPVCADVADEEAESTEYHGVNIRTRTVTLAAGDVTAPVPDEFVTLDGERLRVKAVRQEFGLLEVIFYRNES